MCSDLDENRPREQRGRLESPDSGSRGRSRPDAGLKNAVAKPAETATNPVSMVDVAVLAGVSTQTVSRVANGSPDVRAATRRHVIAAMNELGYRPNSAARALKRGSFRTIGVITFSLSSLGNMRTLEAIALHAARQDFAITLIPVTAPTQASIQGAFSRLGELAVDAVIAIMEVHLLEAATVTLPPGVKVVVVDSDAGDGTAWWTPTRPTAPTRQSNTSWIWATRPSGTSPAPRSPSPANAAPPRGAPPSPPPAGPSPRCSAATGQRTPAMQRAPAR